MFTEKAEIVYSVICCDFLRHCGIRTMSMTIFTCPQVKKIPTTMRKTQETKEGINGSQIKTGLCPVFGFSIDQSREL